MCLAIYKPRGVTIAKRYLANGFKNNDDGAGFAIAEQGKIKLFKGYFTFEEFYQAFRSHANKSALIHFRMATHGKTDAENCHPFLLCNGSIALVHNGVINIDTSKNKNASDTAHFASLVLEPLLENVPMTAPALQYLVETSIGRGNKIALLSATGARMIFNEGQGHWKNGAWYSNSSYERAAWGGFGFGRFNSATSAATCLPARAKADEGIPDWCPEWYKDTGRADWQDWLEEDELNDLDIGDADKNAARLEAAIERDAIRQYYQSLKSKK